jgi:hypothetical protein
MPRLTLDIFCAPCERAGDPEPPRLARLVQVDGEVYAEPYTSKGPDPVHGPPPAFSTSQGRARAYPRFHRRPDGGSTWDLPCGQGHDKQIQEWRILAVFEAFPPGQTYLRISL